MKQKVYLITEYYHSNQNTTGYLFGKLYEALNEQGDIDLTLIAKKDVNCPEYRNAYYLNAKEPNKNNLLKRFFYELSISFSFLIQILKTVKKDSTVFTGTTPIFLLFVLFFVKKLFNFRWILLVHDVFPENLVAANILRKDQILFKFSKKVFDRIYADADEIIVIGKDMQDLVSRKTCKDNITIVQNWIDSSDIGVEDKKNNKILKELNWLNNESTVFQFFGNIGRVQGVDIILKAIQKMDYLHLARFLFIGDGAYVNQLKEQIEKLNLPNIIYYGALDQKDKTSGLNACDIALVTLAEGMLGLGVPSKTYFSMAANKPILAIMEPASEVSDMIQTHHIGWVVPPNCVDELSKTLDEIVLAKCHYNLSSPRDILDEYYSEKVAMTKILKIIRK
ncbi:hypothetical protein F993_03345 [Acinetobacter proteolyticus]|uniref:Glycosyl transferase family 1 domain-containing protein n=1 Tax=Acinetobacter proteolyticus TaxID=1776741 RepID=A0A653K986_9GAMM|nr:glycosyltransferase family 4 protein [Acinetobacter proteolyticus]ENU22070.1 hypothetical protein F993_03345 [Acinetobacter proteolyticus]VXA57013.1 conserved hypothetical protein [Acinetobacter proteolyticus]